MSENRKEQDLDVIIKVGIAGLWRFFDDGYTRWTWRELAPMFSNHDLADPQIQKALEKLERDGFVKFHRREDCYVEVLKTP